MGVNYYCDNCGETGTSIGRVVVTIGVSAPHRSTCIPEFDRDLCPTCLTQLRKKLADIIPAKHAAVT